MFQMNSSLNWSSCFLIMKKVKNLVLNNPLDILHKLEREMHRALHHKNYVHKLDHFYNFCITANSIKDYIFKYQKVVTKEDKVDYHKLWNKNTYIKVSKDIANGNKHCDLKKIHGVSASTSQIIEVRVVNNNDLIEIPLNVPDYTIVVNNIKVGLFEFTREIIDYWKWYLESIGIKYKPQKQEVFFGDNDPVES